MFVPVAMQPRISHLRNDGEDSDDDLRDGEPPDQLDGVVVLVVLAVARLATLE